MTKLLPQHEEQIRTSAIALPVAEARGYRSVTDPNELLGLGFSPDQARAPALLIPVHDCHGRIAYHQIRPDTPRVVAGRVAKYEIPRGQRHVVDVPPIIRPALDDHRVPL